MASLTPRSGLPLIEANQAQKHIPNNEALLRIDDLIGGQVGNAGGVILPFCLEKIIDTSSGSRMPTGIIVSTDAIIEGIALYVEEAVSGSATMRLRARDLADNNIQNYLSGVALSAGTFAINTNPPQHPRTPRLNLVIDRSGNAPFTGGRVRVSVFGRVFHPRGVNLLHRPLRQAPLESFNTPQPLPETSPLTSGIDVDLSPDDASVSFLLSSERRLFETRALDGFSAPDNIGSLTPNIFRDLAVTRLITEITDLTGGTENNFIIEINTATQLARNLFNYILIGDQIFLSSAATFTFADNVNRWQWSRAFSLTAGDQCAVRIVWTP